MATSLVNNKYRITRRIGGGSFGEIYLGVGPSGEKVCQRINSPFPSFPRLLLADFFHHLGCSKI
jgi:hypothetical protein